MTAWLFVLLVFIIGPAIWYFGNRCGWYDHAGVPESMEQELAIADAYATALQVPSETVRLVHIGCGGTITWPDDEMRRCSCEKCGQTRFPRSDLRVIEHGFRVD